ncbi:MAG: hypothetical protein OHK0056_28370 [Bacteriovoracaceae bacterium]
MNVLAVDIGSYSVKFFEVWIDRKNIKLMNHHEVVIDNARESFDQEMTTEQIQMEIIEAYLKRPFDGKIIFQYPEHLTTTRYIDLPITSRKKVELMIPFQLDEMLPFPSSEAHFIKRLEKIGESTRVTTAIAKQDEFFNFYNTLSQKNILPNTLVSELMVVDSYFRQKQTPPEYPVMLIDIGHRTTKCYIIKDNKIYSNHISYIAGKTIDDKIAGTYKISNKEAVAYKHQNCFFLTEGQYQQVSKEQQEFALLMKQAFWPLVMDIRRWDIGFRSKYGASIGKILLTGGTSQINNLSNFLEQAVGIKVDFLDLGDDIIEVEDSLEEAQSSFWFSSLMARIGNFKNPPGSFLFGPYSGKSGGGLPLISASFLFSRSLALSLIICLFLVLEQILYLNPRIKDITSKINKQIKSETLALSARVKRFYPKNPEAVIAELQKKDRSMEQSLKSIQSSAKVNALSPLVEISRLLPKDQTFQMVQFVTDGVQAKALFKTADSGAKEILIERLNTLNLVGKNIESSSDTEIILTYEDVK